MLLKRLLSLGSVALSLSLSVSLSLCVSHLVAVRFKFYWDTRKDMGNNFFGRHELSVFGKTL